MKLLLLLMFIPTSYAMFDKNINNCNPKIVVEKSDACCDPCNPKIVTKYKTRYIKSKPVIVEKEVIKEVEVEIEPNKNRVRLLAGKGYTGNTTNTDGTAASVVEQRGLVLGLSYDRLLNDDLSVSGQIQTNRTLMLGIGLDF